MRLVAWMSTGQPSLGSSRAGPRRALHRFQPGESDGADRLHAADRCRHRVAVTGSPTAGSSFPVTTTTAVPASPSRTPKSPEQSLPTSGRNPRGDEVTGSDEADAGPRRLLVTGEQRQGGAHTVAICPSGRTHPGDEPLIGPGPDPTPVLTGPGPTGPAWVAHVPVRRSTGPARARPTAEPPNDPPPTSAVTSTSRSNPSDRHPVTSTPFDRAT